jgi:uncharacterized protein
MVVDIKDKRMNVPFSTKTFNESTGEFVGYAATYDLDLQRDRVQPGAFAQTIRESKMSRNMRHGIFTHVLLWMHRADSAIGGITEIEEDQKGLRIEGMLDLETALGRRALSAMSKGYMRELSIGFKLHRSHMEQGGVRVLERIDLTEISLVTFAANPEARIVEVKAQDEAWMERLMLSMEYTIARHRAKREKSKMTNRRVESFDEGAFGAATTKPYSIEPGLNPDEDPKAFVRSLRAQLRSEDDALYTLHGKAFDNEVELRKRQREEKRLLEREALAADRQAIADRRIELLESYTLEQLAAKSGIDIIWLTRFVQTCVARGEITPVVEDTLILRGCDYGTLGRRHHEEFETQFVRAGHKRAERLAREKRGN